MKKPELEPLMVTGGGIVGGLDREAGAEKADMKPTSAALAPVKKPDRNLAPCTVAAAVEAWCDQARDGGRSETGIGVAGIAEAGVQ